MVEQLLFVYFEVILNLSQFPVLAPVPTKYVKNLTYRIINTATIDCIVDFNEYNFQQHCPCIADLQ